MVLKLPMIAGGKALRSFQKSVENRSNGKLYVLRGDVELFGSPLGNVHATNVGIILKGRSGSRLTRELRRLRQPDEVVAGQPPVGVRP